MPLHFFCDYSEMGNGKWEMGNGKMTQFILEKSALNQKLQLVDSCLRRNDRLKNFPKSS